MVQADPWNGQAPAWAWPTGILLGLVIGLSTIGGAGGVAFGIGIGIAFALAFGAATKRRSDHSDRSS